MEQRVGPSILKASVLVVCLIFLSGCLGLTTLKPIVGYNLSYNLEKVDFFNTTLGLPYKEHVNVTIPQNVTRLFINLTFYNHDNYRTYSDYYNYSVFVTPPGRADLPCSPNRTHNEAQRSDGTARIRMVCTLNPVPSNSTVHSRSIEKVENKEIRGFAGSGNWDFNISFRAPGMHLAITVPYQYLNFTLSFERYLFSV